MLPHQNPISNTKSAALPSNTFFFQLWIMVEPKKLHTNKILKQIIVSKALGIVMETLKCKFKATNEYISQTENSIINKVIKMQMKITISIHTLKSKIWTTNQKSTLPYGYLINYIVNCKKVRHSANKPKVQYELIKCKCCA